jgi:hypothetical protein
MGGLRRAGSAPKIMDPSLRMTDQLTFFATHFFATNGPPTVIPVRGPQA